MATKTIKAKNLKDDMVLVDGADREFTVQSVVSGYQAGTVLVVFVTGSWESIAEDTDVTVLK